ncbi:MAG: sugar transferase [Spirochaetia bacterium]|jgi:lipopolysaccharide/colanic/teichoic acid biosynthesis glycosyltransferase|nr:sugar transferase [Spirochaetia bacterium]
MVKRLFDIILSGIGLIILSPFLLVIACIITITSPGGVFFRGVRVGKNGRLFRIFKFRSMIPDCEGKGRWNVGDKDPRITKIGHFLRKSKLDELPQLINVFIGDMSLVGPRPELQYYVDMYTEKEKRILCRRPGITDWASLVNISQYKAFTEVNDPDKYYLNYIRPIKLKLQLYYVDHHSLYEDLEILILTVWNIISHSHKCPKRIINLVDSVAQGKNNE